MMISSKVGRMLKVAKRQPAGLALEVEAQRQAVQMAEGPERHTADGALLHLGEQPVARLGEGDAAHPHQPVA
jgi:hypothetical protein